MLLIILNDADMNSAFNCADVKLCDVSYRNTVLENNNDISLIH